jgi:site-specific recombinase XerD
MHASLVEVERHDLITIESGRLDRNPAAVYLAGLAPSSRDTMRRALNVIARMVGGDAADYLGIPWQQLHFQHTAAIRSELATRYSHTTANRMLSALRGVLKAAWKLGQMTADEYQTVASIEHVIGETVPAGRSVPSGELAALLNTCGQDAAGIRDAAIVAVLYGCGLRRAELVNLDLAHYERQSGLLSTGSRLLVHGKRNKQRYVPILDGAARALADWLAVRGDAAGPLFQVVGNRNRGGRMTTQAVYAMLKARATAAGVASLSPHDLRRTFVGDLLDAGADIVTVQKLAGHSSVETTARYDRRDEKAKTAAVNRLHVPYHRRVLQTRI